MQNTMNPNRFLRIITGEMWVGGLRDELEKRAGARAADYDLSAAADEWLETLGFVFPPGYILRPYGELERSGDEENGVREDEFTDKEWASFKSHAAVIGLDDILDANEWPDDAARDAAARKADGKGNATRGEVLDAAREIMRIEGAEAWADIEFTAEEVAWQVWDTLYLPEDGRILGAAVFEPTGYAPLDAAYRTILLSTVDVVRD